MKKAERVKSNILFNSIIQTGKKVSNDYFSIFFINKEEENNLYGITAPKRVGKAVTRNKLKRQTRQLLDDTKKLFKNHRNYIIIIKELCLHKSYQEKKQALENLIGECNEK